LAHAALQRQLKQNPLPTIDGLSSDQRCFVAWSQMWAYKARSERLRLLVSIDETAATRSTAPVDRLRHLEEAVQRRTAERRAAASVRLLTTTEGLDTRAEAELLEQLVAERRAAQGMTDPKDG
jgi:glycine/D-amino acid oxidase-like deaminating enzyme